MLNVRFRAESGQVRLVAEAHRYAMLVGARAATGASRPRAATAF